MKPFLIRYRIIFILLAHAGLVIAGNYLAFLLRFDGHISLQYQSIMLQMLPWLLVIRGGTFFVYRLYKGLWRYTSIWDLLRIVSAVLLSSVLFYLLVQVVWNIKEYPRSIFVIDAVLLILFLGGIRLPWRVYREFSGDKKGKRILIYGAGDAGEMIVRDMKQHREYRYNPVGFLDDNRNKVGQSIHGIPVLGTMRDLGKLIPLYKVEEIVFAIPSAEPSTKRELLKALELFNIPIKTTPNLQDILDEKVTVSQIRSLAVEDLLARMPVNLDLMPIKKMLHGKRVLVTGAGGSIGSELCRQIMNMEPSLLILFERYENGLFAIENELARTHDSESLCSIVGDITDRTNVNRVFEKYKPEIVFHAAAHKHVPLMEHNPCEAVRNNVSGTRILAKTAAKHGVEKFVLISTDKAVNPSSVMGASKRVAEMMIRSMFESMTSFVAVRFGNVLGSNGSVVPLFVEQIKRGGPVTVTHPKMQRYFMLIPEAVQLVLFAAAIGTDAETYVLQMGDQINVAEMARNLIRLSGFVPEVEIPIIFTGLRPGEKLCEELIGMEESAEPSKIPNILRIRQTQSLDSRLLRYKVGILERAARSRNSELVLATLKELVPTFSSLDFKLVHAQSLSEKSINT